MRLTRGNGGHGSSACLRRKCANGVEDEQDAGSDSSCGTRDMEKAVKLPEPNKCRPDVAAILASVCEEHAQEQEVGVIAAGLSSPPWLMLALLALQLCAGSSCLLHVLAMFAWWVMFSGAAVQGQRRWCSRCTSHARATMTPLASEAGPT